MLHRAVLAAGAPAAEVTHDHVLAVEALVTAWRGQRWIDLPGPVRALFDRETAHEVVLRNLLQRRGYDSLSAVREEGRMEGEAAVLLRLIQLKFGPPDSDLRQRIETADAAMLLRWSERILTAATLEEFLND